MTDIDALREENARLKAELIQFAHRVRGAAQSIATTIAVRGEQAGAVEALQLCTLAANVANQAEMQREQEKGAYDLGTLKVSDRQTDSELGRGFQED